MQTSANLIEEHQNRRRCAVFLKAEYLLKRRKEKGECTVVNITHGGACIMFPPEAVFAKGEALSLQIKMSGLKIIIVTGNITWHKKTETACVAGVKFLKPLNLYSFIKKCYL